MEKYLATITNSTVIEVTPQNVNVELIHLTELERLQQDISFVAETPANYAVDLAEEIFSTNSSIFFQLLPIVTILAAVIVVFVSHPVYSLLCLISVFFGVGIIFLNAQAEFVALVFIIVYIGAIAILFLFVIILLNVKKLAVSAAAKYSYKESYLILVTAAFAAHTAFVNAASAQSYLNAGHIAASVSEPTTSSTLTYFIAYQFQDITAISESLYTHYSFLFFTVGLLLLTSMLGAIILATSASAIEETEV